jgi:hypothetical protein
MLVLIAVRRGEERDLATAAEPVAVAVVTPDDEPAARARVQIAAADVGGSTPGALVASIGDAPGADGGARAGRAVDDFATWVAARKRAGVRPTGRMVVEAGFAGSEATGRRWLRDLREQAGIQEAQA